MNVDEMKTYFSKDMYFPEESEYSKLYYHFYDYFDNIIDGIKIHSDIDGDVIFSDGDNYISINIYYPFAIMEFRFNNIKLMATIKNKDELMNFLNDPYSFSDSLSSYVMETNRESFDKCISVCFNILDDEHLTKCASKKK
jgi:hypothetical protein